jgi:lysophospholipase L1-like esterase
LLQPGGGSIDIIIDGSVKTTYDLEAKKAEPVVLRFKPDGTVTDNVRQVEIKTKTAGAVAIASIGIYNKRSGLSYNNIGYPGATVDLVNKFDKTLMADDLRRLNPQIVVISFGTNEASKPNLDLAHYEQNYEKVVGKIKAALPAAEIVLIGPPDGAERGPHCSGKPPPDSACHPARSASPAASAPSSGSSHECDWHTLPKLEGIRGVEQKIAERHGFTYWNWASIMPAACGSHQWALATPPLMARDHVHFTVSGYNKSAEQFLETLIPVIEKVRAKRVSSLARP